MKNKEESLIEKVPTKKKEANFTRLFEAIRQERSFIIILSLQDPDILK